MNPIRLQDATRPKVHIDEFELQEKRVSLNGDGQPEYIGYTNIPNGGTDVAIWMIYKLEYDSTATDVVVRKRLPDNGWGYKYIFDDAATYFS